MQEKNPTLNYLTFGDSLIEPVHRSIKYELLLRKLLKNTPSEDRTYGNIQIALSEVIKVQAFVKETTPVLPPIIKKINTPTHKKNRKIGSWVPHEEER